MLTYTCAVAGGGARLGLRPGAVGLGVGAEPYCETVVERARLATIEVAPGSEYSLLGTCVRPGAAEPDCEPVEG